MIGFRGISDELQASESAEESSGPTKEAQEATNLRLYERALREQRAGCEEEARATFAELLAQPLLAEVDVVRSLSVRETHHGRPPIPVTATPSRGLLRCCVVSPSVGGRGT